MERMMRMMVSFISVCIWQLNKKDEEEDGKLYFCVHLATEWKG